MRIQSVIFVVSLLVSGFSYANDPWKNADAPEIVYKRYLASLGMSQAASDDDDDNAAKVSLVVVGNPNFKPLKSFTAHESPVSYVTFQNLKNLTIKLYFEDDVQPGMMKTLDCDADFANTALVAKRHITPTNLLSTSHAAAPKGCYEYIIDGNGYDGKTGEIKLKLVAHKDPDVTPLTLRVKNCDNVKLLFEGKDCEKRQKSKFVFSDTNEASVEDLPLTLQTVPLDEKEIETAVQEFKAQVEKDMSGLDNAGKLRYFETKMKELLGDEIASGSSDEEVEAKPTVHKKAADVTDEEIDAKLKNDFLNADTDEKRLSLARDIIVQMVMMQAEDNQDDDE